MALTLHLLTIHSYFINYNDYQVIIEPNSFSHSNTMTVTQKTIYLFIYSFIYNIFIGV